MASIGTEPIRSEIVYTSLKLERIKYVATTYACPERKDTEAPNCVMELTFFTKPGYSKGPVPNNNPLYSIGYFGE